MFWSNTLGGKQFKGWHREEEMCKCVLIFWEPHWHINHTKIPQSVIIPHSCPFSGADTLPFYTSLISVWDTCFPLMQSPSQVSSSGTQKPLKITVHVHTICGTILTHIRHDLLLSRTIAFDSVLWASEVFSLSIPPSCPANRRCAVLQHSLLHGTQGLLTGTQLSSSFQSTTW